MKDLEEADVIVGIKITRSKEWISLDHSLYVEKILKNYSYFNHKFVLTPYYPNVKLLRTLVRQFEYMSIIDSLRYVND